MNFKAQISMLMLFIITLGIFPLEFSYGQNQENVAYETHYFLDTGVVFIWKHSDGTWQKNLKPNDIYSDGYSLTLTNIPHGREIKPKDIEIVDVKPYDPNLYSFGQDNFRRWINPKALTESEYKDSFLRYSSNNIKILNKKYDNNTGKISVSYDVTLTPNEEVYNVKTILEYIGPQEVYQYLGGEQNVSQEIKNAIESLKPGKFSSNVEGYMYFVPTVIEYKVKKLQENSNTNYIFSGFNNYTLTHNLAKPHDSRLYTFWMFRPADAAENFVDEFLVEGHSWTFQKNNYIEKEVFPIKHFKLDKSNQFITYDIYADFVPISAVVWRKGKESDKYKDSNTFKENFWAGYTKEYNGATYYYYDTWDKQADGEFYPGKLLDNYTEDTVQKFINKFGYYNKDYWKQRPWLPW